MKDEGNLSGRVMTREFLAGEQYMQRLEVRKRKAFVELIRI